MNRSTPLRRPLLAALLLVSAGCSSVFVQGTGGAGAVPAPSTAPGAATNGASAADRALMLESARLADLAYLGKKDQQVAIGEFQRLGYRAAYFASRNWLGMRYPEVYVLGDARTRRMTLVFVGTDGGFDWVQNVKFNEYESKPLEGAIFLPPGHGGFRRGVIELIQDGFFTEVLPRLAGEWGMRAGEEPVPVRLLGHSMGAGLSIIAAPAVEGVLFHKDPGSGAFATPDYARKTSGFRVSELVLFAPPYTLSTLPVKRFAEYRPYEAYREAYGDRIFSVIRDDDPVPRLGGIGDGFAYRHVGRHYRITRDDVLVQESSAWKVEKVHAITSYVRGLQGQ